MDGWELALLVVAAYLAVMALVRLMLARHRQLADKLRSEMKVARRMQSQAPNTVGDQKDEAA